MLGEYHPKSNRESGEGRFDICLLPDEFENTAIIIECKHSHREGLEKDALKCENQIHEKQYGRDIKNGGVKKSDRLWNIIL